MVGVNVSGLNFNVESYLTYSQIQQIVESVKILGTWAERETNIDMLLLYHATDLGQDEIQKRSHDEWLKLGVIDSVKSCVKNYHRVHEAIEYTESTGRAVAQILQILQQGPLMEFLEKYGRNKKQ